MTEFQLVDLTPLVGKFQSFRSDWFFIFTRPLLPEGSSLQVEILSVCLYVITSTFPFYGLQIIPESCQTPHIIYYWKKDDITDDNDSDTQLYFHCRKNLRSWLLQDPALHSAATLCTLCSLSNHSKVLALCFFYHANLTVFRSMLTNRKKITTFMELNK